MRDKKQHAEYTKEWRRKNKKRVIEYETFHRDKTKAKRNALKSNLKLKYGITIEEYDDMYVKQNGKCAICGVSETELKIKFAVDHDHKTNLVRGLLCKNCNFILGHAYDDITILQNAINYLTT